MLVEDMRLERACVPAAPGNRIERSLGEAAEEADGGADRAHRDVRIDDRELRRAIVWTIIAIALSESEPRAKWYGLPMETIPATAPASAGAAA